MATKKHTEKFDPLEVPGLLEKAKSGDIVARDELLYRFQRLIATLVNVCITGRPNFWSSYQITFLRLFGSKGVPVANIAAMLKKHLSGFEKEELFSTGQLAVLLAIEKCETNLATTIVLCFKDLIYSMIKDATKVNIDIDACAHFSYDIEIDEKLALEHFFDTLDEEEFFIIQDILSGIKVKVPATLQVKFNNYLQH
jgi:hypothetical protein